MRIFCRRIHRGWLSKPTPSHSSQGCAARAAGRAWPGRRLAGHADRRGTSGAAGGTPGQTQEITDGEGRFALSGILAEPTFVFVAKEGYRFECKPIGDSDPVVEVALTRVNEPLPKPVTNLALPLSRAEEMAILTAASMGMRSV